MGETDLGLASFPLSQGKKLHPQKEMAAQQFTSRPPASLRGAVPTMLQQGDPLPQTERAPPPPDQEVARQRREQM